MHRAALAVLAASCLLPSSGPKRPLLVGSPEPPPPFTTRRVFDKVALKNPVYVTSHPKHDRLFLVELGGTVRTLRDDEATPFLAEKDVQFYGMTFHPRYAATGHFYVFANGPLSAKKKRNQILRYAAAGDPPAADPKSKTLVLEWESNGHDGGDLGFGPDGMLYLTAGDGTTDSDENNTGQDLRDLNSGIIRIDVDHPDAGKQYSVPKDNPFLSIKGARPELWAFGLRNPWRMSFDGPDLYVGDVGQDVWEMVYLGKRGANYGWSVREGTAPFHPLRVKGPADFVDPLIEHPHSESRSLTGGVVYRGKRFPDLVGTYVYGDYSTGKLWGLTQKGGKLTSRRDLASTRLQVIGFGADRAGELYVLDYSGQLHTLERAPKGEASASFPRKLSESGLFDAAGKPHPALIPYVVNSPLWSDGAEKERFLLLPDGGRIDFSEKGAWKFPEDTLLVKTFSIDTPAGRRKVETRLMTLQQGEWAGYSYAWDDAQTDAALVEAGGRDATYRQMHGGKERELKWHYPSRVECMVCHTRAANYVLGVNTAQLNRDGQLSRLAARGVLKVPAADHLATIRELVEPLAKVLPKAVVQPFGKVKPRGDSPALARLEEHYPRLTDPSDVSAPAEARARSYLHANCAHCHVWAGGGNAAIDLHIDSPRDKWKLIDVPPMHDKFGIADAKLVATGSPERSVLYARLAKRGRGQMPPLSSAHADEAGLKLVAEWIRAVK
ncbi:MAG: PQQ-dependent sugar dehydrogenase [Gemmataceae bacterium]